MKATYNPTPPVAAVLNAALGHVRSVEYPVGLRWVFYRLLQDGRLNSKDDYNRLKSWASDARKGFWNGWRPDTLIDEGREISFSPAVIDEPTMVGRLPYYVTIQADLFSGQTAVPFLIYESATSDGQFHHFAPWADRAALRGDASIPHKFEIARRIDRLHELYGLPVHVLYFGDLDRKGLGIPRSAMRDIEAWVSSDAIVRFDRIGINPDHAARFDLSEKSLKPGTYEWESLDAGAAGTLIAEGLALAVSVDLIAERQEAAKVASAELAKRVRSALQDVAA